MANLYDIPAEMKHLHPFPKIKEPKHKKSETLVRRSHSVSTAEVRDGVNELGGVEQRQNIKITNYANSDMKKAKLMNSGNSLCNRDKEDINGEAAELEQIVYKQQLEIKRVEENYKILSKQLMTKEELMGYCEKVVEEEWEAKKTVLLDQVIREYLPRIEGAVKEKMKEALMLRKDSVDRGIMKYVNEKIKDSE